MSLELSGKVLEILETQDVSATFKKREFVIEYVERQYPEFIKFECVQDKCDLLDEFKVGDEVKVEFNLKGRKWTSPAGEVKYFNTLQAWRINPVVNGQTGQSDTPPAAPEFQEGGEDSSIPF